MKQIVDVPETIDQASGSTLAVTATLRYSSTAIALHWAIAALVLTTIPLGVYGANAGGDLARLAKDIHKPLGIVILALTLVRVGWRLAHTPPALPVTMAPALRRIARGTHAAFYLLLVALPLSGWWLSSAVPVRHAIGLVLFNVPFLPVPHNRASIGIAHQSHVVLGFAMIGLAALHILAALKHHFRDGDGILTRMLPAAR